jgi:predicted Zn-dependent protease
LALAYAATKGQAQKIEGELQELFSYEDADEQCWDLLAEVTLAANCLRDQESRLQAAMATYPSLWRQAQRLIIANGGEYQ